MAFSSAENEGVKILIAKILGMVNAIVACTSKRKISH